MLSQARANRLKPLLDGLLDRRAMQARIPHDPVQFPRACGRPEDAELVGLIAASLAYGRADVFIPKLAALFAAMGPRPSEFARRFDPARDTAPFERFVYRFNVGADLAALVSGAGRLQDRHGGLGRAFGACWARRGDLSAALGDFVGQLREAIDPRVERRFGPPRALGHLLPEPGRGGACKRLLLYLRWMVRGGPDEPVDLGLWPQVPASALVIPLDTHVGRIGRCLRLTGRADLSWKTALEVTASLRRIDAQDPVKYDFALCHLGMSGACPPRPSARGCADCVVNRPGLCVKPAKE